MNILIIHEIDWVNKVIFEPHHLSELFSKKGHNIFVIDCPDTKNKNIRSGLKTNIISNYSRIYNDASITLIHPPSILIKGLNRISHFLSCKKTIRQTILENKIDIILLYGAITNGIQTIQIAKELKIPVLYRLLDISHGLVRIPIVKHLAKKYESKVLSDSLKVLATTPDLSRYAIEMGAKQESVESFHLGINTHDFKPIKKDMMLSKSLGISEYDDVVVFVGTIYPFSGLKELVLDFEKIKEQNSKIKLLIVGGGPSYDELQKLVIKKNLESQVILTDFKPQKEIPKYISLADLCINPFQINYVTNRILPTKILEYFACGKPVLSTPLSGTKEMLPDEKYGIIYSELEDFVITLPTLLLNKDRLERLGKQASEYVHKNHDWEILSEQLLVKFESLVKEFQS
ncbi:MAG: glycosyltransferase [Nitrosarchaeum sp.]|nr:glycosyltransferase [Nitrosarchaeum sp.]